LHENLVFQINSFLRSGNYTTASIRRGKRKEPGRKSPSTRGFEGVLEESLRESNQWKPLWERIKKFAQEANSSTWNLYTLEGKEISRHKARKGGRIS